MIILGFDSIKQINCSRECDGSPNKTIPVECRIDTGKGPIVSWQRPIRHKTDKEEFIHLVNELEERGIVEASTIMWCNPVVLTRNKNGSLRFCIDFQRLNDFIVLDGFEIPNIRELITGMREYNFFTTIDLKDGFFQVPIVKEDREKTTFVAGNRLMQFKMMPQGFMNSPSIFQRGMTLILDDLIGESCQLYMDDMLVYGKTSEEHDDYLKKVLIRLQEYGLEDINKRFICKR